ncbi:Holliday junction resolvase [Thermoplasmatales archaeon SG8-52-2]|nr:MAG: Holliday junction resolvase [Thermoplasmatales archaeon SG8-52-2]
MSASQYERELKNILEGESKTLSKITKTCNVLEKMNYSKITDKPFAVIRAAGSFGVDLVATRGDISFLTEVKSSIEDTIHFSSIGGKLQEQALTMKKMCEKTKTLPIYAFRSKGKRGDSWRIFTLNLDNLEGRPSVLHKRLPKLKKSNKGYFIMRWDEGMPLSDFISYLCK